jgi:hypothetical protein
MLVTGRAPDATTRAFRSVRDAGCYHLLFGWARVDRAGHGAAGGVS